MQDAVGPIHFAADSPITGRAQDFLNRRHFAEALARAIAAWRGDRSLVIALYGAWGSGKSSIKNMMVETLRDDLGSSQIGVLEFNPWEFANRNQITEAFFSEVGKKLGRSAFLTTEDRRRAVARWKSYGAYLKAGVAFFETFSHRGIYSLLMALSVVPIAVAYLNTQAGWLLAGIMVLLAAVTAGGARLVDAVVEMLERRQDAAIRPLPDLKSQLSRDLSKLQAPLLVVLDDVDRLTPDETLIVFQLLKSNADFPKVVYFLLFDRAVVEKSVEQRLPVSGRAFLEKIIQTGFTVPNISRQELDRLFGEKIEELFTSELLVQFRSQRWKELYASIRTWFTSLRELYRFLSSLEFHVALFRDGSRLDVNPLDLLGLEVLRVFEPDVYQALAGGEGYLTGRMWTDLAEHGEQTWLKSVLDALPATTRGRVGALIVLLFPRMVPDSQVTESSEAEWRRDQRVCSPQYFNRYFQLALYSGDLRRSDVDRLLAATQSGSSFAAVLSSLQSQGLLVPAIWELQAAKDDLAEVDTLGVIKALLDSGDALPYSSALSVEPTPDQGAAEIIETLLSRRPLPDERTELLIRAVTDSVGLYLPVALTQAYLSGSRSHARQLLTTGIASLKEICLARLRSADASTRLRHHPSLGFLLGRWVEWGDVADAARAARVVAETPEGALNLCRAVSERSVVSTGPGAHGSVKYNVSLDKLERLVAVAEVEQQIDQIDETSLDDEDILLVQGFRHALAQRRRPSEAPSGRSRLSSGRRRAPIDGATLEPIKQMLESAEADIQVSGLRALRDLASQFEIEADGVVVRRLEQLLDSQDVAVQVATLDALSAIFFYSSRRRNDVIERFRPKLLALLSVTTPRQVRDQALQAATNIGEEWVIDRLVDMIGELPADEVPKDHPPSVALILRNMVGAVGARDVVLARLRTKVATAADDELRRRLLLSIDLVSRS